jgi:fatty-acyl-CoA synthase
MLGQMMDMPLLISNLIEFAARFHGDVEVVSRTPEGSIHRSTWRDVAARSRKLAHALIRLGVKPGDRVATIAWNTHRHLELYFAVSGIGAVLHTINPRFSPEQMRYVIGHAEDRILFFDTTFFKAVQLVAAECKSIQRYVALTDAAHAPSDPGMAMDVYETAIASEPATFSWPKLDERTASSLCYTSGTAGDPKGVLYSHRSTVLHSYGAAMADSLAVSARDVTVLPVVPMFHANAWGVPYAAAMVGSKLVLPGPGLDGKSLYELIANERVTSLLGVPTVWLALLGHLRAIGAKLETVEKVTVGGSACPPSMIEALEKEHGARVIHAWGMTETSPVGTVNVLLPKHRELEDPQKLGIKCKQGRPIAGIDLRLVDDDGNAVAHDGETSGHLQVQGPWVASGYFKGDDAGAHRDGWFYTGDIATIDPDGYMHITDRSKDVIKSGGEWISSIALENAAMSHPAVAQAAAVAVRHEKWVERPLLVVAAAPGKALTAGDLSSFLSTKLMKWWLPDAIEFVDALPVGPTGKVLKRELRARFADYVLPTDGSDRR